LSVRIGTWNVEYAREARRPALEAVLAENPADIWVLTETHDALIPPGCVFAEHSLPRPSEAPAIRPGSRWVSIWSRYPIQRRVDLPSSDRERTVTALIDLGSVGPMLVYGTVLPWKGDRTKFDWSEHHRVIAEQSAEWLKLRALYPNAAHCVAGDYNSDLGTGAFYGTRAGVKGLRDGLAACDLYCPTAPEWFPAGRPPPPLIDHIALPARWKDRTSIVAAWAADKSRLSDHSGVVVEVADT
jgi:exonuclease III